MSMNKVSMALDDVIKADRKGNKKGKKAGTGASKKAGKAKRSAAKQPATAQLVKKLVKRALAQHGVSESPRNIRKRKTNNDATRTRTIVKKIVRRIPETPRNRSNKSLGISQRSRTIVRRRDPQPARTIVREVRYIRDPPRQAPRVQRRVVYQQPPPRQVVYVERRPRRQQSFY